MKTETTTQHPRQFSRLAIALLGLFIMQITGCEIPSPTTVPEGSAAMKRQALSFAPPLGKVGIYVMRPYQFHVDSDYGDPFGNIANIHVSLDYQEFGSLQTNSYLFGLVMPGKHALGASDVNIMDSRTLAVPFIAEAGKNYYFTAAGRGKTTAIALHPDVHINPISETDGQSYVRQFKLSGDNRFEYQNPPGQTQ